jgi:hypothetical protein
MPIIAKAVVFSALLISRSLHKQLFHTLALTRLIPETNFKTCNQSSLCKDLIAEAAW